MLCLVVRRYCYLNIKFFSRLHQFLWFIRIHKVYFLTEGKNKSKGKRERSFAFARVIPLLDATEQQHCFLCCFSFAKAALLSCCCLLLLLLLMPSSSSLSCSYKILLIKLCFFFFLLLAEKQLKENVFSDAVLGFRCGLSFDILGS